MPLFWLRIALALYGLGLVYAIFAVWGSQRLLTRITLPVVGLGTVFHLVSIVEGAMLSGNWTPASTHEMESMLAFVLMVFFFAIYLRYHSTAPGLAVFPMAFLLTLSAGLSPAGTAQGPALQASNSWIYTHVTLILIGYGGLLFSFVASMLYLVQEKNLKAKSTHGFWSRLPSLATMDEIGYRCLIYGFPFMTLGLIGGSVLAEAKFGPKYFLDTKILLSILMWVVYTVLLYTRWSAGWRGRRAAYLSAFAFVAAILAWVANNMSHTHRFIAS
ncbi:MAG TPA: cytochrome c biogenesis protein CcsA [Terriglobales bacterium]|nr:cytochrome c biogenesis protein CcsA [Terriglobales bacterium]